jgi:hypothetical protein
VLTIDTRGGAHRQITATNAWFLRQLYRNLEISGANRLRDPHAALDSAVCAAYGLKEREDHLDFPLRLKRGLTSKRVHQRGVAVLAILGAPSQ